MKKWLYLSIIIIILISLFVLFPGVRNSFINPFQSKTLTSKSIEKLETIKISQFRSASYTYKALFPYDFIYGVPKWGILLYKDPDFLTKEDIHNINFYYKCREIGVDLNNTKTVFILSAHAIAGFDINRYLESPILSSNEELKHIVLKSPKAELLTIEMLDKEKDPNYPEVEITPGQWQKLTTLLQPLIEEKILDTGIIETADEINRSFLEELFYSLSWNSVEFK